MTTYTIYAIYDFKRDLMMDDMLFSDEQSARDEFSARYNALTKNWLKRAIDRYVLVRLGQRVDGVEHPCEKPVLLMWDVEVKLDYERFFAADPPFDEASEAAIEAEYDRLCSVDAERLARRRNIGV